MGILEKTRALLVSKLGPRLADARADTRALRDLILELERARSDVVRGLDSLRPEAARFEALAPSSERDAGLAKVRADISEGEVELKHVVEGIEEAKAALAAASKSSKAPDKRPK